MMTRYSKALLMTSALLSGAVFGISYDAAKPAQAAGFTAQASSLAQAEAAVAPSAFINISGTTRTSNASEQLIQNMGDEAEGLLANGSMTDAQRRAALRELLVNNFDLQTIGRFVLGRYWRQFSDEQRREYFRLFEDMIVSVYSERFDEYSGQDLVVKDSRPSGDKDMIVSSVIKANGSGQDIQVDWRVRRKNDGAYKIIDVVVEGVSMSVTQRSDFSSVIQRGGGRPEVLLQHLRKS